MAGAIFQDILIFFRPRLDLYRGDFRGLGGESPVATVYFFRCAVMTSNDFISHYFNIGLWNNRSSSRNNLFIARLCALITSNDFISCDYYNWNTIYGNIIIL